MDAVRPLNLPVILGTTRKGRMSAHAARFMTAHIGARPGVETELIDIASLPLVIDDAGEATKNASLSEKLYGPMASSSSRPSTTTASRAC